MNWLLTNMNGKACNHDDVYTKRNFKTGKVYAVKLCNPNTGENFTQSQKDNLTKMGAISSAVSQWVNAGKAASGNDADQAAYKKALASYNRQHKYATLRGMVASKYASVASDMQTVTIKIGDYSKQYVIDGSGSGSDDGGSDTPSGSGYKLTIKTQGSGSVTKSPDKTSYDAGDVVTLTAVPASGKEFMGWSDGNTSETRTITMNSDKTLTAEFED